MRSTKLKVGDWVEVRSKEEILGTLDKRGQLDGLPFMPHMFRHCGQRFRVFRRAHKTCDTVFPVRSRRMVDAVHLETRCSGAEYGGCQAGVFDLLEGGLAETGGGFGTSRPSHQAH